MRHPQVLIHESEHDLAGLLGELRDIQRWAVRRRRSAAGCLKCLSLNGPTVLVVEIKRDSGRERLLEEQKKDLGKKLGKVVPNSDSAEKLKKRQMNRASRVARLRSTPWRRLQLLEAVQHKFPKTAMIVVYQLDDPILDGLVVELAWTLGAGCVLPWQQARDNLREIVSGLLQSLLNQPQRARRGSPPQPAPSHSGEAEGRHFRRGG